MATRKRLQKLFALLLVLSMTMGMLNITAFATEGELICGQEEHTHTAECYEQTLSCGQEESEEHVHTEDCYGQELVCVLPEHTHTDACYSVQTDESEDDSSASDKLPPVNQISNDDDSVSEYVACIGDEGYDSLQAAIDAAEIDAVIELQKSTAEDLAVSGEVTLTLDLNGYELVGTSQDVPILAVSDGANVTVQDGTITGKILSKSSSGVTGLISISDAALVLDNCLITDNQAGKTNSAIIRAEGGSLAMIGGKVEACTQKNAGNMVKVKDCAATIENVQFLNNTAAKGVISLEGTASLNMDSCTFSGNSTTSSSSTSSRFGTLHVLSSGDVSVADTTFEASAGKSSAIYVSSAAGSETPMKLTLTDVAVSGYNAYSDVVYVKGAVNVTAEKLQLEGNTTEASGAILNLANTGTNSMTDCIVTGNQAKTGYAGGSTVTVVASAQTGFTRCAITDNTSGSSSAGVNVVNGGNVTLDNCMIWGNRVENDNPSAGGLYLGSNAVVTAVDTVIKENLRVGSGNYAGGIYINTDATYTMNGGALYKNVNETGGNANDLYSGSARVSLPEANEMKDGDISFADYEWMNNGSPLASAPDGTVKKNYSLTAKIYSTKNVQIIRNGEAVGEPYETLNQAISAAAAGDTLQFVSPAKEVNLTANVTLGKDLTIDMNGCTLVGTKTITLEKGATLTLQGTGTIQGTINIGASSTKYGHLVLDGNIAFSKEIQVYGQSKAPSSVMVNTHVDSLAVSIGKYATFTVAEEASVGTLDLSLGKSGSYPYDVTANINGSVDNLTLSQTASKGTSVVYSVANLNSHIDTLTLVHYGWNLGTDNTNPYSQVIAGENFSVGSVTYQAAYLSKNIVQQYSTAGSQGLADIPFLSDVDEDDVNLAKASWTASSTGYLGADKDLTTVQLVDGSLVLHYAPYSGDVYLSGNGDDSNSGKVPSSSVQTVGKALELLKEAQKEKPDAIIVVTGTTEIDGTVSIENVTFQRYTTLKEAMFDITGEVTLIGVTVDGNGVSAQEPLIDVRGGTLNIETGTVLTGGVNTGTVNASVAESKGEGGAVRIKGGTVNLNGGSICDNSAYVGGGVMIYNGTFNMTGGLITDNAAVGKASATVPGGGGGVLVAHNGIFNMSGGTISNNTSANVGGGVALGGGESNAYVANDCHPAISMTGGTITENTSAEEGGGIFVQCNGVATITKGAITNNTSNGGNAFSGGGIYVNGGRTGFDNGQLNLSNVWISENTAQAGGGIAGCPTSNVKVYLKDGGVIWGNQDADKNADDIRMVAKIMGWNASGTEEVYLSRYMMGGGLYQWTNKADDTLATSAQLFGKESHLYSGVEKEELTANEAECSVIITGNVGALMGGGIGTNGDVTIGEQDPNVEYGTVTANKNWKSIEGVDMSQEVYQKLFSVTFDLYYRVKDSGDEWTLLDTKSANLQADLTNWGSVHFTNLMIKDEQGVEYEYKVEERTDDRYTQVGSPVQSDDGLTWTFTNTPAYSLKVVKQVVGSYNVAQNEKFTFHITLSDTTGVTAVDQNGTPVALDFNEDNTATVQLAANEYVLLTGLKYNTTYTVTEDAHSDYNQSITLSTWKGSNSYQTETVNKIKDQALTVGMNTVTVTNTTKEPNGALAITKNVTGSGSASAQWNFTVNLFLDAGLTQPMPEKAVGKPAYAFTYTVTNANGTEAAVGTASIAEEGGKVLFDGKATMVLVSGQTVTITGIPVGVFFQVEEREANQDGYETTVAINGTAATGTTAVGQIVKDTIQNVEVTNYLRPSGGGSYSYYNVTINYYDQDGNVIHSQYVSPDIREGRSWDYSDKQLETIAVGDVTYTFSYADGDPITGTNIRRDQVVNLYYGTESDLEEPDVPGGELPEYPDGGDGTDPGVDIEDPDVPGAEVPETGDISALWLALSALSGTGLVGVTVLGRKKRDEE